jgi:hypothetical protein
MFTEAEHQSVELDEKKQLVVPIEEEFLPLEDSFVQLEVDP